DCARIARPGTGNGTVECAHPHSERHVRHPRCHVLGTLRQQLAIGHLRLGLLHDTSRRELLERTASGTTSARDLVTRGAMNGDIASVAIPPAIAPASMSRIISTPARR